MVNTIDFADILSQIYSERLFNFAKASEFMLPLAKSKSELDNVDEINKAIDNFNWFVKGSGIVARFEERPAAIIIKDTAITAETKVKFLTEAVLNKESFVEAMRYHSERMYTPIFIVDTEGNRQIEALVRVLADICVENLPHFGFYDLRKTNEMILTTNKEDVEIRE